MLKLVGASLIIISTTLIGFYFAQKLSDRTKQIRALQMSMQVLETEIVYASTPLLDAFKKMNSVGNEIVIQFFKRIAYYLENLDGETTSTCWRKALQDMEPKLALKKDEVEWIRHFGQVVGISDSEDQQKHLRILMTNLQKAEKVAEEEQGKYEKMYRTLGLLSGLVIVILLL